MTANETDRSRPGRWERVYLWPHVAARRFAGALARHWKRVLVGGFVGWGVAVVVGATTLALLEVEGVISRGVSDTAAIGIVLGGIGLGALDAYERRPAAERSARSRERATG